MPILPMTYNKNERISLEGDLYQGQGRKYHEKEVSNNSHMLHCNSNTLYKRYECEASCVPVQ